jgi:malonyl-CoA/methylmalonyl-CoA synthetase
MPDRTTAEHEGTGPSTGAIELMFPPLADPSDKVAIRFPGRAITYRELAGSAARLAARLAITSRVAVWATSDVETCVAVVAALAAGVAVVPIDPRSGPRQFGHIVTDSDPELLMTTPGVVLPDALSGLERVDIDVSARGGTLPLEAPPEAPAMIVYTSGTTGPPKGAVLPRRAIVSNIDALAAAWEWTADDVLTHALPLFHVHGLVLGVLGPLRLGGTLHHLGRFSTASIVAELAGPATMLFAVPTMYRRLAQEAERDPAVARALGGARLLVSGSAALPVSDHEAIARASGQRVVERYGMTETLIVCSVRSAGDRRPGWVGPPLDGVQVRLVDDDGVPIATQDGETVGEIQVRGPNVFLEYLDRPDATAEAMTADGWFRTGDMATRAPDDYLHVVGRRDIDLIQSGGFKIGAGEIENALLEYPGVADAAVTGEPDPDLGQRVTGWIVAAAGAHPSAGELADYVARQLSPQARPRTIYYLKALPRNEMGKVVKKALVAPPAAAGEARLP